MLSVSVAEYDIADAALVRNRQSVNLQGIWRWKAGVPAASDAVLAAT
jgi:hypothetical protein